MIDIWLYIWSDCTKLVTYARLHILTSVVCLQLYYLFFICRLIYVIVIQLSFIFNFRLIVILYTLFICMSTSPFLMHSLGRFLTTLDLHVQILDLLFFDQVLLRLDMLWRARVSLYLILVLLSSFLFMSL